MRWDAVSNEQASSKSIDWDWQESQFYGLLRTYLSSGSVNLRSQRDNQKRISKNLQTLETLCFWGFSFVSFCWSAFGSKSSIKVTSNTHIR